MKKLNDELIKNYETKIHLLEEEGKAREVLKRNTRHADHKFPEIRPRIEELKENLKRVQANPHTPPTDFYPPLTD